MNTLLEVGGEEFFLIEYFCGLLKKKKKTGFSSSNEHPLCLVASVMCESPKGFQSEV